MTYPGNSAGGKSLASFAYRARTAEGQEISGTIDALDAGDARRKLELMQLREIVMEAAAPAAVSHAMPHAAALRGEDFMVFNQQLAQLTGAGLPVEQGLRMVAREMHKGSMRRTLDMVALELESGKSLPQAVARHRANFPPLYSELIEAGIRAGNLSGILLNLGNHLTLIRRLQAMLWRTLSYPVIVLGAFLCVLYFMLVELVPKWEPFIGGFSGMRFWTFSNGRSSSTQFTVPFVTQILFAVSNAVASVPGVWVVGAAIAIVLLIWAVIHIAGRDGGLAERVILPMPLIGIVLRRNLIARWCHAVALGTEAGMDLPGAIKLADDATASPHLRTDGAEIIAVLNSGQPLSAARAKVLPATVMAAMEAAAERGDLPVTLRALSQMYQQQAELRIGAIQAILTPVLLIIVGLVIGALMIAMFAPMLSVLNQL